MPEKSGVSGKQGAPGQSPQDPAKNRPQESQFPEMGQVLCTKGIAKGQGFMLPPDRMVIVGKSKQDADLVIDQPTVSSVHCSIFYNSAKGSYVVKDHSTNGTYVAGKRLEKNRPIEVEAHTVLSLSDGSTEITLG